MVVQNSGVRRNSPTRVGLVNTLAMAHNSGSESNLLPRTGLNYTHCPLVKKRPRESVAPAVAEYKRLFLDLSEDERLRIFQRDVAKHEGS